MGNINYSIHYRKWHSDSEEHFEAMCIYYKKKFLHLLPQNKEISILDIGCGFGLLLYCLREIGYKNCKGIDISNQQIEVAKKKGLDVECVLDTNKWLEEKKEKFDVIFLLDVLEHIKKEDQLKLLQNIYHSLKKGGKLIVTVPNSNSTFGLRWRYIDWTHEISFTEHSLEFILLNSGFKNVRIEEIEYIDKPKYPFIVRKSVLQWFLFKFFRYIRRLQAIAELGYDQGSKIPLSLNILGVAEK